VTLLLSLYWSNCLIIHVLVNLQVHTWVMSLASSGKFVYDLVSSTDQLTCLDVVHASVITDLFAIECFVAGLRVSAL
jgi:hypothetical protein